MSMPLVSWLMPVYNGGKYIRRALDSMLHQTVQDFEIIIVVEHGCTDNTLEVCEEYAERDSRIKICRNDERLGITRSLNRGLDLCRGKYIARMDADDYSHAERLERQVAYMESNPDVGILCTNRRVICNNGITYHSDHPTDSEEIHARLLFGFCLNHPSMMIRNDLFREKGWKYPEKGEAEDYALCTKLLLETKVSCLPDVLLDYFEHGENAIFTRFPAVRAASADISRDAIYRVLGVDTRSYPDIYFGWRENDVPPYDIKAYLLDGMKLYNELFRANEKLKRFNPEVFTKVLSRQWQLTLSIGGLSALMDDLPVTEINAEAVTGAAAKFRDIYYSNARVVVYGTGKHCSEIFSELDGHYPFSLVSFCDSDAKKHGTEFFGRKIIAPEQLPATEFDYILIASPLYEKEIREQLISKLGVQPQRISNLLPAKALKLYCQYKKYDQRFSHAKGERKAYLFCAPDYGNLGDHAIAEAEHRFFRDRFGIELVEIPVEDFQKAAQVAKQHITSSDLILITGGGFLGSLWLPMEEQARTVIETYPNNPVVVLPQTLYWEETAGWAAEREKTRLIYASHPNLTLCARDKESYRLMSETYPDCRVILAPDMVLADEWKDFLKDEASIKREGILLCLKTDKESILSADDQRRLFNIGKYLSDRVKICNTDLEIPISAAERNKLLHDIFSEFQGADLVITDRLHGLVFSAIAGTPCVALNNCNHKMRATFGWIKSLPYLRFAEDLAEVEIHSKELLSAGPGRYDRTLLLPQFEELELTIKVLIGDSRNGRSA